VDELGRGVGPTMVRGDDDANHWSTASCTMMALIHGIVEESTVPSLSPLARHTMSIFNDIPIANRIAI
jgi:hypothetical protein